EMSIDSEQGLFIHEIKLENFIDVGINSVGFPISLHNNELHLLLSDMALNRKIEKSSRANCKKGRFAPPYLLGLDADITTENDNLSLQDMRVELAVWVVMIFVGLLFDWIDFWVEILDILYMFFDSEESSDIEDELAAHVFVLMRGITLLIGIGGVLIP
ncbi:hypothetical protein ACJX0J_031227, partial [Zea mays]